MSGSPETHGLLLLFGTLILPFAPGVTFVPSWLCRSVAVGVIVSEEIERDEQVQAQVEI